MPKVRFLQSWIWYDGKEAKRGDIYEVPEALASILLTQDVVEILTEEEGDKNEGQI
ncbi:hypothetical protein H5T87_05520 [bacterium]|nr:hypothetical protein [bacterium]